MNSSLVRVFWSLLIHLAWLIIAIAILYLVGGSESSLNELTRSQYSDNPATLDDIRVEARWQLITWVSLALAVSWLLSGIWIFIAGRERPRTPLEGGNKRGLWAGFLFAVLLVMALIGWSRLWRTAIQVDLSSSSLAVGILTIGVTVLLAFFSATGICVKPVMRPSVPFSSFLPNVKGRS